MKSQPHPSLPNIVTQETGPMLLHRLRPAIAPSLILLVIAASVTRPAAGQVRDTLAVDSVIPLTPLQVQVLRSNALGARTPYAVAGLGAGDLAPTRPTAFLSEALVALPGLQVQNRYNFAVGERFAVRGFGSRSQFGVRGLRIYLDGIPATLPDGQATVDHVDGGALGRVELLRGPAAALYGNGAGGVLLLESSRPDAGRRYILGSEGGSHGLLRLTGAAESGSAGTSSRVQITRLDYGGFRSNPVDGGTYGEAERWTVTARHERELAGGRLSVVAAGVDLDAENPGSLPADSLGDPDRSAWGFNVRQGTGKEIRQAQLGARWVRPLGNGTRDVTAAAWGLTRDLTNPIPNTIIDLGRTALGGRVALGGGSAPVRWDAGLEVEAQRDERRNFDNDGGEAGALTLRQNEAVTGLSGYAALALSPGPVDLHLALRYDRIRFSVEDRLIPADGLDESGNRTLDAWSPSLGASVDVGRIRAFTSFSTFLQTPTTTELANRPDGSGGFNPDLEPTTGWTVEAGVQAQLARRVGLELVGFVTDLRDELIPFEVPSDPGRTYFRNEGESRYKGLEAAARLALEGGVTGRLAYTWVDARFRGGDLDGNQVPGRAPHLLEAVVRQDLERAFWEGGIRWSGPVPTDDDNENEADAYTLLGVRAGLRDLALGGMRITPWVSVQNLLDADYVSSVVVNAFGGRYYEPGPGRTFQVGARAILDR
jgi:iron complex outermembrane receptor protein